MPRRTMTAAVKHLDLAPDLQWRPLPGHLAEQLPAAASPFGLSPDGDGIDTSAQPPPGRSPMADNA